MPSFGRKSAARRDQCDPQLIRVLDEAIKHYDFSIIYGHRDRETQNTLFENGKSQVRYPYSKHNRKPAYAFDVVPYPQEYAASDEDWHRLASHILAAASALGVRLRWGGHWRNFKDCAHFELMD